MKQTFSTLAIILFLCYLNFGCNDNHASNRIVVKTEDLTRSNYITLSVNLPVDSYDRLVWYLPGNRKVSQLKRFTSYIPQKGDYTILLKLYKDSTVQEIQKKIHIPSDDPYLKNNETLIWDDEFDGSTLNPDWWSNETDVHVNNELQTYTNGKNYKVDNGHLIITARKETSGSYTSARLSTQHKKEFTYGRVEIRAQLPSGRGTWPALWMLGAGIDSVGWPACGENDMMEHVGYDPSVIHSSLHSLSSFGQTKNTGTIVVKDFDKAFHIYGVNWTPEKLEYYIDSPANIYYTYAPKIRNKQTWPFCNPFFFILNLAVGGDWGGQKGVDDSVFPQSLIVDYVRIYQPIDQSKN